MVIDALPLDAESVAGYLNHEDDHHGDRGGPDRGNLPHSPGQPANGRRVRVLLRVLKLHGRTT